MNLTFVVLFAGYLCYYLCRQNWGPAYVPMHNELGFGPEVFGWISSVGTFVYAFAKVATGSLPDRFGGRRTFLAGLLMSALCSFALAMSSSVGWILFFWSLNLFFQAMGWGSILNIVSARLSQNRATTLSWLAMSYQLGGVLVVALSGTLLAAGFSWRALFWMPGLVSAFVFAGVVAFFSWEKKNTSKVVHAPPTAAPLRAIVLTRAFFLVATLHFSSMLIKEFFIIWGPAFFVEKGASASAAAFRFTVFPFAGCVGTLLSGWACDKFFHGKSRPLIMASFVGMLICFLGFSVSSDPTFLTILFMLGGFFIFIPISLVSGVVSLELGGHKRAATLAGVLDGIGYFGAVFSGVGPGQLFALFGWRPIFILLAGLCLFCFFVAREFEEKPAR